MHTNTCAQPCMCVLIWCMCTWMLACTCAFVCVCVCASTSVFMHVFLQVGQRGRGGKRQTAGHSFTPSADSSSVDASPPHLNRNSWSCHRLDTPPSEYSHLEGSKKPGGGRGESDRVAGKSQVKRVKWNSCQKNLFFLHENTFGVMPPIETKRIQKWSKGDGLKDGKTREKHCAKKKEQQQARKKRCKWEKINLQHGSKLAFLNPCPSKSNNCRSGGQTLTNTGQIERKKGRKRTQSMTKRQRGWFSMYARVVSSDLMEKERNGERGFQVQAPFLLNLWLQFPLLYCNSNPGSSYENTLSVGLERCLTSRGFSHEATGTLLNSTCPRQQRQKRQIALVHLANYSYT